MEVYEAWQAFGKSLKLLHVIASWLTYNSL